MKVKIKRLTDTTLPRRATKGSAAYDVYAAYDQLVAHGRQVISLGFSMEIEDGYEAKIEPRSGYSSKGFVGYLDRDNLNEYRFQCDVLVGKIDSDYRGIVGVIVNNQDRAFFVKKGQRIAQMTFYKVNEVEFEESELSDTERGEGGFGHTGWQ